MQWFFKMRCEANFPVLFFGNSDRAVPDAFKPDGMPVF
jgi:hypothetical protein